MNALRSTLVLACMLLAGEASAFVDAPPRSPTVLIDVQGGTARLVFIDYQTTAIGPGTFCGLGLNLVAPLVGVMGAPLILDGVTFMPLPQFAFTPNPTVGSSFGGISPGSWEGFFSNVTGVVAAGNPVLVVFQVSIAPGTTFQDLELALRGAGDVIATDTVGVTGVPTGANQNILPAGCMLDVSTRTMSHSADPVVLPMGSVACGTMGGTPIGNGYMRSYRPLDFGFTGQIEIAGISFGIQSATAGSGLPDQPIEIRVYRDPTPPDPAPFGQLVLLHTEFVAIPDTGPTMANVPLSAVPPVTTMAGETLVVEIFAPDGRPQGHAFRMGVNNLGQTSPSFIVAPNCGVNDPTDLAALGFPDTHYRLDIEIAGPPPPPPPTCMLMAPMPPTRGDISFDIDTTTVGCTEVDIEWGFSTDGGATFTPCTPAAASPLGNPGLGVPAGSATFVWDSRGDGVGLMAPQAVDITSLVTDDIHRLGAPALCMQALSVDNSSICTTQCGDCDLNGSAPDVLDSLTAAQIAVAIIVPTMPQTGCCDIDSDMDVDVLDSLGIAQSAVSLPVTLTCP